MWIRSQDKKRLIKIDNFEYYDNCYGVNGNYIILGNGNLIGEYTTEEKALKVLDMIGNYIEGLNKKYIVADKGNPKGYEVLDNLYIPLQKGKANIIFQMPQDDDV